MTLFLVKADHYIEFVCFYNMFP